MGRFGLKIFGIELVSEIWFSTEPEPTHISEISEFRFGSVCRSRFENNMSRVRFDNHLINIYTRGEFETHSITYFIKLSIS